jgi:proteasome assembly chaperone (PAC2) family protein
MQRLTFSEQPQLEGARLVLGFSGWMNGGDVSKGTIEYLKSALSAKQFAQISPQDFYIFSFPGTMDEVAQFRPHCKIEDGVITEFDYPTNAFFYDEDSNLVLFYGKEPHLHWDRYAEYLFQVISTIGISALYFAGSVAGAIPHTREVRISCSVATPQQKQELSGLEVSYSNYEGPASITTLITRLAREKGKEMTSLVAEVPVYVQTENHKAIRAILKRLVTMLKLPLGLADLTEKCANFEKTLNAVVAKQPQLAEHVRKLEEEYDNELFHDHSDFEKWLRDHGINAP